MNTSDMWGGKNRKSQKDVAKDRKSRAEGSMAIGAVWSERKSMRKSMNKKEKEKDTRDASDSETEFLLPPASRKSVNNKEGAHEAALPFNVFDSSSDFDWDSECESDFGSDIEEDVEEELEEPATASSLSVIWMEGQHESWIPEEQDEWEEVKLLDLEDLENVSVDNSNTNSIVDVEEYQVQVVWPPQSSSSSSSSISSRSRTSPQKSRSVKKQGRWTKKSQSGVEM